MSGFYDTLVAEGECPPDCSLCAEACTATKGDGRGAGITNLSLPEVGITRLLKCNQCSEPACVAICPTHAITKSDSDGVVRINDRKCVGCGLCSLACPYGGIHYSPKSRQATKCDNCDGEPKCVEACNYDVLSFVRGHFIFDNIGDDVLARGGRNCMGCGVELLERIAIRTLGKKDLILLTGPGCSGRPTTGRSEGVPIVAPLMTCLMTNIPSCMTGVKRYYEKIGRDVTCVCFVGDGATADVGFQPLSGAAERNEKILYICFDNEVYGATGYQRSGTTPYLSWTTTTPVGKIIRGKRTEAKSMPLLLAFHGIPYVATATVAFLEDYVQKLLRAKAATKRGMAYIHVLAPCPTGWRTPEDSTIELSRIAVETNYFPLWEAQERKFRFTYRPRSPKPIEKFTKPMGRFSHLTEGELGEFQAMVNERLKLIESLTRIN